MFSKGNRDNAMDLELLMKETLMILFASVYFLIAVSLKRSYFMKYLKITTYLTLLLLLTYIAYKVVSVVFRYIFI